jgi:signal transduction histidine kinase
MEKSMADNNLGQALDSATLAKERLEEGAQHLCAELDSLERASLEEIRRQAQHLTGHTVPRQLLEATPSIVLVLNRERQVIYANQSTLGMLGLDSADSILGLAYGEALDCVHAFETQEGCGRTEFCKTCGAASAISSSQRGQAAVEEWRITRQQDEDTDAFVLRVWTTPLEIEGEWFTVFACIDVSHEMRRRALERIFFHDVLNTAGMLMGAAELMPEIDDPEAVKQLEQKVRRLTWRLINEIKAQRDLTEAENNELSINLAEIGSLEFLHQIGGMYMTQIAAAGKHVHIAESAEDVAFVSDPTLLGRVIGNMVKNALEASQPGQTVTLGSRVVGGKVELWVHNAAFMPKEVQLQVFQRAFSTKGAGRGLGTYSMKLLSQRYLRGDVSFTSSEEEGTTFRARYPL